jgi:hypothetical protein
MTEKEVIHKKERFTFPCCRLCSLEVVGTPFKSAAGGQPDCHAADDHLLHSAAVSHTKSSYRLGGMADQRGQRSNIGVARSEATVLESLEHTSLASQAGKI